jgi:hypothetical protein
MFQPASLQALARCLQILSDSSGASNLYVRSTDAVSLAKFTVIRRASSRVNRIGRLAVRRSDMSVSPLFLPPSASIYRPWPQSFGLLARGRRA